MVRQTDILSASLEKPFPIYLFYKRSKLTSNASFSQNPSVTDLGRNTCTCVIKGFIINIQQYFQNKYTSLIGKQNSIQKQRIVLCELHVTHCQPIINELLVWIKIKIIFIITNCLLPSNIYRCYQYDLIMRYDQANFKINTLYV